MRKSSDSNDGREREKTIFHCAIEKRQGDGAALAAEKDKHHKGPRGSYQHMAEISLKQSASRLSHQAMWSRTRNRLLVVLNSGWYSVALGIVILLNTLLVIHEVDELASGSGVPGWVKSASNAFTVVYAFEIAVKFYVFRSKFWENFWNLLDLTVVVTDIASEIANTWDLSNIPSMSVLRICRLVRLIRLIAMLSVFPELQTMLLGFGSAMKAIVWASLMIGVVLTVCSICAVIFIHPLNVKVAERGVYGDCTRCGRAFETVAESNLTLIQNIIAGDSWGQITIPIIEAFPFAGVFFLLVFGIIDLGVINLVLMVIVNAAETARAANQEVQFRKKIHEIDETKHKLKHLCKELDTNSDGRISLDEFLEGLDSNEDLRRAMAGLDVQRQDAEIMFYLMDEDKSGDVDFHEFVGTLVATMHESMTTKLLFLKASIHQIYRDVTMQTQLLEDDVAPMVKTKKVAEVVKSVQDEASSQMCLQWKEIMNECQGLTQKVDQRWQQLQAEQAKSYDRLERVVCEAMLLPPPSGRLHQLQQEVQSYPRETPLPNSSLPSASVAGKAQEANGRRWCSLLCNPSEPAGGVRRLPVAPVGCESDRLGNVVGNDQLQHGLIAAQSALTKDGTSKMSWSDAENNLN